jgi:hypothetical protein
VSTWPGRPPGVICQRDGAAQLPFGLPALPRCGRAYIARCVTSTSSWASNVFVRYSSSCDRRAGAPAAGEQQATRRLEQLGGWRTDCRCTFAARRRALRVFLH